MLQRCGRLHVLVLAAVIAILIGSPACSGNSQRVKLVPARSLGKGIYRMDGIHRGAELTWSPDGKYLARLDRQMPIPECFLCGRSYSEIFLVNTTTWEEQTVSKTEYHVKDVVSISWFPDSRHIAYIPLPDYGEPFSVWSIDIDGKNDQLYMEDSPMPIWSPDGSKIALRDAEDNSGELTSVLYMLDPATKEKVLVYKGEGPGFMIDALSWEPTSKKIAFSYGRRHRTDYFSFSEDIYVLDLESGEVAQVTNDKFDYEAPVYAPVGTLIAVQRLESSATGEGSSHRMTVIKDLAQNCEIELPIPVTYSVSWAPNGQKLVIAAAGGDYIVDLTQLIGEEFRDTGSICR